MSLERDAMGSLFKRWRCLIRAVCGIIVVVLVAARQRLARWSSRRTRSEPY